MRLCSVLLVFGVSLLITSAASGDRTITQKTLTLNEVDRLYVSVTAGGVITAEMAYHVLSSTGQTLSARRSLVLTLTPAQITTLQDFLTGTALPQANAAEGT
jgi:hypothetical protein